ncbi:MAG: hypothetical protein Q8N51_00700 [Gammaproteobacteria bacterium]|nr:hypothetical protein [Gammaproteobacteria bacterium]
MPAWTAYRITFRPSPRGRVREWVRLAPSLAAAKLDAYRVVHEEFHGRGKVLSVEGANSPGLPVSIRTAVAA